MKNKGKKNTKETNKSSTKYLLKRLIENYVKKHFNKLIFAFICMAVVSATTALNAWMMQPVLDDIFLNKDKTMLVILPVAVLLIAIFKGIAAYFQSILMNFIGFRIVADAQTEMLNSLLKNDLAFFDETNSGTLVSRFLADVGSLTRGVHTVLTNILKDVMTIIFLISLMFYHDWKLAFFAFIVFPVSILPIIRIGKRIRKISRQAQVSFGDLSAKLTQVFTGIKTVKSFNMEKYEQTNIKENIEEIFFLTFKSNKINSIARPLMETLGGIAIAVLIWIGGNQVIDGSTTPGTFFSFITALLMAYQPVKSLAGLNATLQTAMASAQRIFNIIDNKPKIIEDVKVTSEKIIAQKNKDIIIDKLYFKYLTSKNNILSDFSLKIPYGKTTAIVGPSGAGKTTLLNLIPRFYDPQKGNIYINRHNIKNIGLKDLRSIISIVSQDVVLFDNTIKFNINYGSENRGIKEIIEASDKAGCNYFISKLKDKYNSQIGENGVKLSGGQRQRISIARAFLKNSPFLLLDEATSSLDSESEQRIQKALDILMIGRTTLVIAHRLSTIKNADQIIVMDKGRIIEIGSHKSLIKKSSLYKKLYQLQFSKNEKNYKKSFEN